MARALRLVPALLALCPLSNALATVRVVDAAGGGNHTTIQAAIDASSDGDLIVIRPSTYAGFTIDGKSLSLVSSNGSTVVVAGGVVVRNLTAAKTVVLSDLRATGANATQSLLPQPGLSLANDFGAVRVQNSTWIGGQGRAPAVSGPGGAGAPGVLSAASLDVSFVRSTLTGGDGGSTNTCFDCAGGAAGAGLDTSTSAIALDHCTLKGGTGGRAGVWGGRGGFGANVSSWGFFATGCAFQGGAGGEAWDWAVYAGGAGGDGLSLHDGTSARLLDDTFDGGAGGACPFCFPPNTPGPDGQPTSGPGLLIPVAGSARRFAAPSLVKASQPFPLEVTGLPGDVIYQATGSPGFRFKWGWHGVWLLQFPAAIAYTPLGTIGATGTATVSVTLPALASPAHEQVYFQGVITSAQGETFVASPFAVARVDCSAVPAACTGLP